MANKHCSVLVNDTRAELRTLVTPKSTINSEQFKTQYGFKSVYNSLQSALENEEIDIVYIITPNNFHTEQIIASLTAGKNVFCEKPLAYTMKEFNSIEKILNLQHNTLQVGMNCRYREQFSKIKTIISQNELGELRYIKGTYIFNLTSSLYLKPWWMDYPTGIYPFLHTGAIHTIDLVRWFCGTPKTITSLGSGFELKDVWHKDNFVVLMEMANDVTGEFVFSASANIPSNFSIELWGSKGSIKENRQYYYSGNELTEKPIEVKQDKIDLLLQFDDLISSIEKKHSPLNSFAEAKMNYELINAIENSVKTKNTIQLY